VVVVGGEDRTVEFIAVVGCVRGEGLTCCLSAVLESPLVLIVEEGCFVGDSKFSTRSETSFCSCCVVWFSLGSFLA
jgi:hypothetical protein